MRLLQADSQHFWSSGQSVSNRQSDWLIVDGSHVSLVERTVGQRPNLRIGSDPLINESVGSA
jgi:hypothetical protein